MMCIPTSPRVRHPPRAPTGLNALAGMMCIPTGAQGVEALGFWVGLNALAGMMCIPTLVQTSFSFARLERS